MIRRLFAVLLCAIGSMMSPVPATSAVAPEPVDRVSDDIDVTPEEAGKSRDGQQPTTWHPVDNFR